MVWFSDFNFVCVSYRLRAFYMFRHVNPTFERINNILLWSYTDITEYFKANSKLNFCWQNYENLGSYTTQLNKWLIEISAQGPSILN
jgi:hypothetical protein